MAKTQGIGAVIILVILALIFLAPDGIKFPAGTYSILSPEQIEPQLKEEYTTACSDKTDCSLDEFTITSETVQQFDNGDIYLSATFDKKPTATYNQIFKGQEVVAVYSAGWDSHEGSCSLSPVASFDCTYSGTGTSSTASCPVMVVKYKPHALDTGYDVYQDDVKVGTFDAPTGFQLSTTCNLHGGRRSANANIHYIGYKAEYSCDLAPDMVWVQETFSSPFSSKDLEFVPSKLCHETKPFTLRTLDQGEKALTRDEGINSLNKGKTLNVPSGSYLTVNYATYYVSGVLNRCSPNQVNAKDSAGKWYCKDIIASIPLAVQCNSNTDCPIPLKNTCPGYFKGCIANKCVYDDTILDAPVCKNEIITIVKQIEQISQREVVPITGSESFTFSNNYKRTSFNIGSKSFINTKAPSFTCSVPSTSDFVYAPSPSSDCWRVYFTYGGNGYSLKDSQSINLETVGNVSLIKVQFFASGRLTRGSFRDAEDWGNTFVFTINKEIATDISTTDGTFVLQSSQKKGKIILKNNLPSGNFLIKISQRASQIGFNLPDQMIDKSLQHGENTIEYDLNTMYNGNNKVSIVVYSKISADNQNIIPVSDKVVLNYEMTPNVPSQNSLIQVIEIEDDTSVQQAPPATITTPTTQGPNITGFMTIILIAVLALFAWKVIFK